MNDELIGTIRDSWSWAGPDPFAIVAVNEFGNVIFRDQGGAFWRICPEDLSIALIATDPEEFDFVRTEKEFEVDWSMVQLVASARSKFGKLESEQVYCLKLPAALGGQYDLSNMGIVKLKELIQLTGDLARQIKDLPDGAKVRLKIID